jgi:hypothetical protein
VILAIDPGNEYSAYIVTTDKLEPMEYGKIENNAVLGVIESQLVLKKPPQIAIEMVASYGMPVGAEVFETCVWIGRFVEASVSVLNVTPIKVYRKDVKTALCGSQKARDANIRQALIDRFGVVGTKKAPGFFYGFKADIWQAYAVAVTYHDLYLKAVKTENYILHSGRRR